MKLEAQLSAFIREYPEIRLALLFGSRARGRTRPSSDLDLALLADNPIEHDFKRRLIEAIGVEFGMPADIVDLHGAPEPILGEALRGRRLVGDDATYGNLLTMHVMNAADFLPLQQRILAERRAAWIG